MATTRRTAAPTNAIAIDLDALEREASDVKPPFVFVVGEREVMLRDVKDLPWEEALEVGPENLLGSIVALLPPGQKDALEGLEVWRLEKLFNAYQVHYGLGKTGNAAGSRT